MSDASTSELEDEYEEWLDRLRSTYESVGFTCLHRLGERQMAERVSAQVVAGMITKPGVFRYFGLPYSARIGHLTEDRITAARLGEPGPVVVWSELLQRLRDLSKHQREMFVLTCVRGLPNREVAKQLGLHVHEAVELRREMLEHLRAIAGVGTFHAADDDPDLDRRLEQ